MSAKGALVRLFAPYRPALAEELAGRSDRAVALLFDAADCGMALVDANGLLLRTNPALRAMLAPDVALDAGAEAALIFAPAERAASWRRIETLMRRGRGTMRFAARLRPPDAAEDRLADISCTVVTEADGAAGGVLLRIADITERARLETQLAETQGLQAVGRLAGGVAHDFNNLLTTILGAVEMARERGLDPETAADMEQIRRSAERGAALVRNLLALGRQQHLQARALDVNATLRGFADMLRRALAKGIVLDLALEEPGRAIRVDPGQLDQVLMNLAMNAQHAMPDGGTLTLASGHATLYRPQAIGHETIPPGRYVTMSVRDTGTGIPPELLGRIFQPFFTTRRAQGGSGLGLASAHGIVRQSGGYLTMSSTVGQGTEFVLYFPREEAHPAPQPPAHRQALRAFAASRAPAPAAAPAEARSEPPASAADSTPPVPSPQAAPPVAAAVPEREGRRVLLADDEHAVRRVAARALSRAGWDVLEADSAEAALTLLDSSPALQLAALVSDVVMPGQDGPALVEAVRARYPGLPAILMSGYAEQGVLAGETARSVAFLGKPYTPKDLVARLAEVTGTVAAQPA
ncbi:MAG: response regulator [Proteobacteria bacterium]|nr:response regulator [Pseudomonadota bacterium]